MATRLSLLSWVVASVLCGACGQDPAQAFVDDDHGEYDEWTWGQGLRQGVTVPGRWVPPAEVIAIADQQDVDVDEAPPYDGGANCSGGSTPGARVLRDVLVAAYPQVSGIGIYNCRVIADSNSMSLHGVGRGLDVMIPTLAGDANNTAGDEIAHWLMQNAERLGLQRIIWDHSIWSTSRSPRHREFTGDNPHVDHLHIEINEAAAFLTLPWYAAPTGPGPAPACDVVGADGVVDAGPCQQLRGPSQYWRTEAGGYGGQLAWTNAFRGDAPSNTAVTTIRVATPGRYRLEAYLDDDYARSAQTRYRLRGAGDEQVLIVNQGAIAPVDGGFVNIGELEVNDELTVVVEDNADVVPPSEARSIMVDAFRVVALPLDTDDADDTDDANDTHDTEAPTGPTEPTSPSSPGHDAPNDADQIIDEGDADSVLDADDPGTAGEIFVEVDGGGCAQGSTTALSAWWLSVVLAAGFRRRRR
jgi:hypothetical protein